MAARPRLPEAGITKSTCSKGAIVIRTGDVIENPITGESLRFLVASADTGGEYCLVECTVQPDGAVAAAHIHPYQTETFHVVSGTVRFQRGKETVTATAGDVVTVAPGTVHKFWNDADEPAVFRCEVRPALTFESLVETMFALATDGKTNRKGMPNPLRLAVIAKANFDHVRLPFPPVALQRLGLALGAPLGRALGFGETYEPAPATRGLAVAEA
jgi:quercetin dioxygenase-like cupin family protein